MTDKTMTRAEIIDRAVVLLETAAKYGVTEKYDDGTRTPNSILCEETAKQLSALDREAGADDLLQDLSYYFNAPLNEPTYHLRNRLITRIEMLLAAFPATPAAVRDFMMSMVPPSVFRDETGERPGEKYAGITIHDGKPAHLYLLPGEIESATWKDAMAWAAKQGGELPSRIDHLVLLKNLKPEFKKTCHWSSEDHADDSAYAWDQSFFNGGQDYWHKDNKYRARAVRRVPIQ